MKRILKPLNIMDGKQLCVSVIITIYNGEKWIKNCMDSITKQTARFPFEIVVFDDASTDGTKFALDRWTEHFRQAGIPLKVIISENPIPHGVGYGRNVAVKNSAGEFLCFQDVDDVMLPERLQLQYEAAKVNKNSIVGSKFRREPEESTLRFTKWANNLSETEIHLQVYTSHGPTLIMPTWFCSREIFDRVGGFSEEGHGTPEDLIFFYRHLDLGGSLHRVNEELLIYNYHAGATTFSIDEKTIWNVRLERLQRVVLSQWQSFTIWNAGKQGRRFYQSLLPVNQERVVALCDVDVKKIGTTYISYDPNTKTGPKTGRPLPIISYKYAVPPLIICIKLDLTGGQFEEYLKSLKLEEGKDYVLFS